MPFEGSGYLPPSEDWGQPGLANVVDLVVATWTATRTWPGPGEVKPQSLMTLPSPEAITRLRGSELTLQLGDPGSAAWREDRGDPVDPFGPSPRRPEPELYRTLLRGSQEDRTFALNSLRPWRAAGFGISSTAVFPLRHRCRRSGPLPPEDPDRPGPTGPGLSRCSSAPDDVYARTARGMHRLSLSTLVRPWQGISQRPKMPRPAAVPIIYSWSTDEITAAARARRARLHESLRNRSRRKRSQR